MNSMTVAQLKALASDMNLSVASKARKADIIDLITAEIDRLHTEAIAENETREIVSLAQSGNYLKADKSQDETARLIDGYYERMRNRLDHYTRQNGTIRLTARQARRYNKKTAKQAKRLSA